MTEITHEALEALNQKATQGEAMTNPRQALVEALERIQNEGDLHSNAISTAALTLTKAQEMEGWARDGPNARSAVGWAVCGNSQSIL